MCRLAHSAVLCSPPFWLQAPSTGHPGKIHGWHQQHLCSALGHRSCMSYTRLEVQGSGHVPAGTHRTDLTDGPGRTHTRVHIGGNGALGLNKTVLYVNLMQTGQKFLSSSWLTGYGHFKRPCQIIYERIARSDTAPTRLRHRLRHGSDTAPAPVRLWSGSGPALVRLCSDSVPTPVRHRSDSGQKTGFFS